jgi:hypothetical protein
LGTFVAAKGLGNGSCTITGQDYCVFSSLSLITEITSFVLMVAGRERKTIHDYIAGTVVLHDPNKVLAS